MKKLFKVCLALLGVFIFKGTVQSVSTTTAYQFPSYSTTTGKAFMGIVGQFYVFQSSPIPSAIAGVMSSTRGFYHIFGIEVSTAFIANDLVVGTTSLLGYTLRVLGDMNVTSSITAGSYYGDGSQLTGITPTTATLVPYNDYVATSAVVNLRVTKEQGRFTAAGSTATLDIRISDDYMFTIGTSAAQNVDYVGTTQIPFIQASTTAASLGGGKIKIREGEYQFQFKVEIASTVEWEGSGRQSVITTTFAATGNCGSSYPVPQVIANSGTIRGMGFSLQVYGNDPGVENAGVRMYGGNPKLIDNFFYDSDLGCTSGGGASEENSPLIVAIGTNTRAQILGNTFEDIRSAGDQAVYSSFIKVSSTFADIDGNIFFNNPNTGGRFYSSLIRIEGYSGQSRIRRNSIIQDTPSNYTAFKIIETSRAVISDNDLYWSADAIGTDVTSYMILDGETGISSNRASYATIIGNNSIYLLAQDSGGGDSYERIISLRQSIGSFIFGNRFIVDGRNLEDSDVSPLAIFIGASSSSNFLHGNYFDAANTVDDNGTGTRFRDNVNSAATNSPADN